MAKINTNSNVYTIVYATVLVIIVAVLLAVVANVLKPRQDANVALDTKKQILSSLNVREINNADAEKFYQDNVTEKTCEKCGLSWFEANINGETKYVVKVSGAGLWGPIWGYIAFNDDKNTIYGTFFNHEGETPGLGGEIKTQKFQDQFIGKHILATDGTPALGIMKAGQTAEGMDQVDAISGATITSKGVEAMIATSLKAYAENGWFGAKAEEPTETADAAEEAEANVEPSNEEEAE